MVTSLGCLLLHQTKEWTEEAATSTRQSSSIAWYACQLIDYRLLAVAVTVRTKNREHTTGAGLTWASPSLVCLCVRVHVRAWERERERAFMDLSEWGPSNHTLSPSGNYETKWAHFPLGPQLHILQINLKSRLRASGDVLFVPFGKVGTCESASRNLNTRRRCVCVTEQSSLINRVLSQMCLPVVCTSWRTNTLNASWQQRVKGESPWLRQRGQWWNVTFTRLQYLATPPDFTKKYLYFLF